MTGRDHFPTVVVCAHGHLTRIGKMFSLYILWASMILLVRDDDV